MEKAIKLKDLNALLEAARQLDSLLKESPEITAFAEVVKESREPVLVVPQDRLILAHEAAKILCVNPSMISKYVRAGMLKPWYIPGSSSRRFKLADVWALPGQSQYSTTEADDSVAVMHEIGGLKRV